MFEDQSKSPDANLTMISTVFYLGFMVLTLAILLATDAAFFPLISVSPDRGFSLLELIGLGVLGGAVLVSFSYWLEISFDSYRDLRIAFGKAFSSSSGWSLVYLAVLAALSEELFFRGCIQPHIGVFGAALFFGLLHLGPRGGLSIWTGCALFYGVILGLLFDATDNLIAPAISHGLANMMSLFRMKRLYRDSLSPATSK